MREIDTDALHGVAESLGIGNPATVVGQVEFQDEVLQQVLDVARLVRRSRAGVVRTQGVINFSIDHTHPVANTITTDVDVYGLVTNVSADPPWPEPEKIEELDIYLLGCSAFSDTDGAITSAVVQVVDFPDGEFGGGQSSIQYCHFAGNDTITGNFFLTENGTGLTAPKLAPLRIPRAFPSTPIRFRSTAGAAADVTCILTLGLFPRGLGQDVVGAY